MSGSIDHTTCTVCGGDAIYITSTEYNAECEHTFCFSNTCGYYEMMNENPEHPDYPKNGEGHHTPKEVEEIREIYGYYLNMEPDEVEEIRKTNPHFDNDEYLSSQ